MDDSTPTDDSGVLRRCSPRLIQKQAEQAVAAASSSPPASTVLHKIKKAARVHKTTQPPLPAAATSTNCEFISTLTPTGDVNLKDIDMCGDTHSVYSPVVIDIASPKFSSSPKSVTATQSILQTSDDVIMLDVNAASVKRHPNTLPVELRNEYFEASNQIEKLLSQPIPTFRVLDDPLMLNEVKEHLMSTVTVSGEAMNEGEGSEVEDTDMGISPILKAYLRIVSEGALEPLSILVDKILESIEENEQIASHFHAAAITKEKLNKLLPIFLNRKRFGLLERPSSEASKFEDVNPKCFWVWESPSLDYFPPEIRETARVTRDARSHVSKRLKALSKLQESLLLEDSKGISRATEWLDRLAKKELEDKEKRLRWYQRRKQIEERRRGREMEKAAKEMERAAKEMERKRKEEVKRMNVEDVQITARRGKKELETPVEAPPAPPVYEKSLKEERMKKNQQEMMMRWLNKKTQNNETSDTARGASSPRELHSPFKVRGGSNTLKKCITIDPENSEWLEYVDDGSCALEVLDEETLWRWIAIQRRMPQYHQLHPRMKNQSDPVGWIDVLSEKKEDTKAACICMREFCHNFANPHSQLYRESCEFYLNHRLFRQEVPSVEGEGRVTYNDMTEKEIRLGLLPTAYGYEEYRDSHFLRTVYMNDNEWKRPARHLLIGKYPERVTYTNPIMEESYIDYDTDSDDEWFEAYDADDVDEKDEEDEEEEADEEDDFIVPDEIVENVLRDNPTDMSTRVDFDGVYGWNWWFEGTSRHENSLLNSEDYQDQCLSIFGCVRNNCSANPFDRIDAELSLPKKALEEKDIIELLKHCHGKQIAKPNLIEEFRSINLNLTKADIERKFRLYLTHEKRPENKKAAWYVKDEAVVQFNLQNALPKILMEENGVLDMEEVTDGSKNSLSSNVLDHQENNQLNALQSIDRESLQTDELESVEECMSHEPCVVIESEPSDCKSENTAKNVVRLSVQEGVHSELMVKGDVVDVEEEKRLPHDGDVYSLSDLQRECEPTFCSLTKRRGDHLYGNSDAVDETKSGVGFGEIYYKSNGSRVSSPVEDSEERNAKKPRLQAPSSLHATRETKITQYFRYKHTDEAGAIG